LDTTIEWEAVPGARGYLLSAGTTGNLTDIVSRLDLGLVTSYSLEEPLPEDTRIFFRVIPYNNWGEANNCPQWSFTTIRQQAVAENLPIPKFFTPNNDGFNDSWMVRSTPDVLVSRVWIFNRFGKLLKQLEANQSWDGNLNGRPLASDSYWYRIETVDGRSVSGYFLLKR
jgi:gliding motility-associated-like protein